MIGTGPTAMIAAFFLVALRSFQQQNVIYGYYAWAIVVSYAIAFADIGIVLSVVHMGWPVALWIGTGGAFGVTTAMYVHRRFLGSNNKKQ